MPFHRFARGAVIVALALIAAHVWAGPQARLSGSVTDTDGKPIPNVSVTITTAEQSNYKKVVDVNADGTFSALILDATKHYVLRAEAPDYAPMEEEFKIGVGSTDNEFHFKLLSRKEIESAQQDKIMAQPGYKELGEGRELLKAGNKAEAKTKFEAAVAAVPDLLPAWQALLDLAYKDKDYAEALKMAKRCLEIDDESVQCLGMAANSAQELGKTEEHQQYIARYQELNPEDPAMFFNQAVEHLNKMDDEKARPLLEKCLEVDPDFPKALFEYGMLLLRTGDMEGAKAKLQRYLEVAPDGPDAATAADTVKYL